MLSHLGGRVHLPSTAGERLLLPLYPIVVAALLVLAVSLLRLIVNLKHRRVEPVRPFLTAVTIGFFA